MLEYIKVRSTEEIVQIEASINCIGIGTLVYSKKPLPIIDYFFEIELKKAFPIGEGKKLILKFFRNNSWTFKLVNPSTSNLEYEVSIKWFQGNDIDPIHVWTRKGIILSTEDHILIGDPITYTK